MIWVYLNLRKISLEKIEKGGGGIYASGTQELNNNLLPDSPDQICQVLVEHSLKVSLHLL